MSAANVPVNVERVVVTGGRGFADAARMEADLRALKPLGLRRVAQGGHGVNKQFGYDGWPETIKSADALAFYLSHYLGLEEATYRVERQDGLWPAAGPRRNVRMLEAEQPTLVLAYPTPESRGTWRCIESALRLRIPVMLWAPSFKLQAAGADVRIWGGKMVELTNVGLLGGDSEDLAASWANVGGPRYVLIPRLLGGVSWSTFRSGVDAERLGDARRVMAALVDSPGDATREVAT